MGSTVDLRLGPEKPDPEGEAEIDRCAAEMAHRWAAGERVGASDYFDSRPGLLIHPSAHRLVLAEAHLRLQYLPDPQLGALAESFPLWRRELEEAVGLRLTSDPMRFDDPAFPAVGEWLGEFELVGELGRGAEGAVYLARQPALGDRPLAIKVVPRRGQEHLTLARLQHTHIVPLYAAGELPERDLRWLAMPYLGGTSLVRVIAHAQASAPRRDGALVVEGIDRFGGPPPGGCAASPWRALLGSCSYVEAVCRIGLCLAQALQHAHERGLLHLDLKPGNVLIAADGTPMLLDFHLAHSPLPPGEPPDDPLGGTPGYMAPEQAEMVQAISLGRPLRRGVDARADVYGLGLVLYEALGGPPLPMGWGRPAPLHLAVPGVPRGLSDVIRRCLESEPEERYGSVAELAEDLSRHLADRPLRHVPNRSWRERYRKWRRRRPAALPVLLLLVALLGVGGGAAATLGWQARERREDLRKQAVAALDEGRERARRGDFAAAREAFRRGLTLAADLSDDGLRGELDGQLRSAHARHVGGELRALTDRLRFLSGSGPVRGADALARSCADLWGRRDELLALPDADEVRTDLLDLAILRADLEVRRASPDNPASRQEALRILDEAEALLGPNRALSRERRRYADEAVSEAGNSPPSPADGAEPESAWECYALGRRLVEEGRFAEADRWLTRAIDERPGLFWPRFERGASAFRQGKYEEAVRAFDVCVALSPQAAECYFNRAQALGRAGRDDEAAADYTRALARAPNYAAAALNRGVLHYRAGRFAEAAADFEQALRTGGESAGAYYNLALARLALGDPARAQEALGRALHIDPNHAEAKKLSTDRRLRE